MPVDGYIARLVKKGFRVAICEQVEDPKKAKGLVRREVVRVVSPGTLTDSSYLDAREPAFLMAIATSGATDGVFGAALIDLSTGEFSAAEYRGAAGLQALADEVAVLRPREIVVSNDQRSRPSSSGSLALTRAAAAGHRRPRVDASNPKPARRALLDQLKTHGLEGFGLEGRPAAIQAAGALVSYLRDTQKADLAHVRAISYRASATV